MFNNFKSRNNLNVSGKMNEQDAGKVGKLHAIALIILVVGASFALICLGLSFIKWW